jgi:hypothetical protein
MKNRDRKLYKIRKENCHLKQMQLFLTNMLRVVSSLTGHEYVV